MDTPILARVYRIAAPAAPMLSPVAPRIRPNPMLVWMRAEGKLSGRWATRSRKARLKVQLRVLNPLGRKLTRWGVGFGMARVADGAWLVWSGAWDLVATVARKLAAI